MDDLVEIGSVRKTHGYRGEVKLVVVDGYADDLRCARFLFVEAAAGAPLPYEIRSVRGADFIVALSGIENKEDATSLRGKITYLRSSDVTEKVQPQRDLESSDASGVTEYDRFLGYAIIDVDAGELGMIEEIIRYPQQLLAKIHRDEREVLIPMNRDFITGVDFTKKIVFVTLPEGLVDLK